jgi:hypothetical protein
VFFLLPVTKLATSDVDNTEQPTTPRPRESAQTTSSMQQAAHSVQHATAYNVQQHTTYNSIQCTVCNVQQHASYNGLGALEAMHCNAAHRGATGVLTLRIVPICLSFFLGAVLSEGLYTVLGPYLSAPAIGLSVGACGLYISAMDLCFTLAGFPVGAAADRIGQAKRNHPHGLTALQARASLL